MIISCPECDHNVSDLAPACPNCGYPIRELMTKTRSRKKQNSKHQRLPNGFGRITEIKNRNLRRPFRVMVSDGKDDKGKPIGRLLKPQAYFETYNEAYQALMEHNSNPYDFSNRITMDELYKKWYAEKEKTLSDSTLRNYKATWDYCESIKDIVVQELRIRDVKNVLDNGCKVTDKGEIIQPSSKYKRIIKQTISSLLDYAAQYEIVKSNILKNVKLDLGPEEEVDSHISFTDAEMKILWENITEDSVIRMILIQCYMGWRPTELVELKTKNIIENERYIIGGMKTASGKNRMVPIHSRISSYVFEIYNEALLNGSEKLFSHSYYSYKYQFDRVVEEYNLNPNHKPHDCRKQFVTMAKKSGVDEYAIRRIVGHKIRDLTENVYTDRSIEWLRKEIEKIP